MYLDKVCRVTSNFSTGLDHLDQFIPSVVDGIPVYRFILVETAKSAKNIWEPVLENIIILGF